VELSGQIIKQICVLRLVQQVQTSMAIQQLNFVYLFAPKHIMLMILKDYVFRNVLLHMDCMEHSEIIIQELVKHIVHN
jgi:hypothetical protein